MTIKEYSRRSLLPNGTRLPHLGSRATAAALLLASTALFAQTTAPTQTPAPAPAPKAELSDEDLVYMSPFVVNTEQDQGYAATNTLAGTRLNSQIVNTPIAISVMTREFLNDIGAVDATKAMEYALNADNNTDDPTGNSRTQNAFNFRVRGFGNATVARNYFGSNYLSDSYNVDSMDIARGPNSVLFGIASPAGVYNSTIKIARPGQTVTAVQLRVGSFGEYRGTVDIARTFGKKKNFALRVNLLEYNSNGYYEFEKTRRRAATITATWRPFKYTNIRFEYEKGRFYTAPARPFPVSNGYKAWVDAGSVYHTPTLTSNTYSSVTTNPMFSSLGGNIVYFPESTLGNSPVTYGGGYFRTSRSTVIPGGTSTDLEGIFDTNIVPRNANMLGKNNGNTSDQDVIGLFIEQRITKQFSVEAAAYRQKRDWDSKQPMGFNDHTVFIFISTNDPVFDPVTNLITGYKPNGNAGRYVVRSTYQEYHYINHDDNFRMTTAYDLDFTKKQGWTKWLGRHQIGTLLQRSNSDVYRRTMTEANVDPTRKSIDLTTSTNFIDRANFVDFSSSDDTKHSIMDGRGRPVSGTLLGSPGVTVTPGMVVNNMSGAKSTVDSAVIATQSNFFKEKLWVTAGMRHDTVMNSAPTLVRDATTKEYLNLAYDLPASPTVRDTTKSFGAAYHVMPWLTVFANASDNFAVQSSSMLFGETGTNKFSGNTKGQGRDVGIRSKLFNGKVNINLGFYKTIQGGQYTSVSGSYISVPRLIWDTLGETTTTKPILVGGDLQDLKGQGIEFELTANPTKNIRLTFNYGRTNRYGLTKPLTNVFAYLDKWSPTWTDPANASKKMLNTTYGPTVLDAWNYIKAVIVTDQLTNGRMPFAFRPETANFFGRYSFTTGKLKGLATGLGVNWRGPMVLAYANNDGSKQLKGYEQYYLNGMLSYECKFAKKITATFQLNVDNMLGFDEKYPRRYYWFDASVGGPSINYQYPYLVRRWSLSSTFRF